MKYIDRKGVDLETEIVRPKSIEHIHSMEELREGSAHEFNISVREADQEINADPHDGEGGLLLDGARSTSG